MNRAYKMKNISSLVIAIVTIALTQCYCAEVGIRYYHKGEVAHVMKTNIKEVAPVTFKQVDAIQLPVERYPKEAIPIRKKFTTNILTEEFIFVNCDVGKVTEKNIRSLIKRIAAAETAGWTFGDIIAYREPSFNSHIPTQDLFPGPWSDTRLIAKSDVEAMREAILLAFKKKKIKRKDYRICALIYAWDNMDDKAKAFAKESLDGLYVELNSRGGGWPKTGKAGKVGYGKNYIEPKKHSIAAYGMPGNTDSAKMAKWCLENKIRFGITTGSNVRDIWFKKMFTDFFEQCTKLKVDYKHKNIMYLIHHNNVNTKKLPYYPESSEATITNLTKFLIKKVK
jgi:hypothetical protein